MASISFKDHLRKGIVEGTKCFIDDLEAMPDKMLALSPGGAARCPYDLTYEVAYVNRRVASRLRGEDPGPWSPMPWTKAPEDFQEKAKAIAAVRESADAVLAAWDALPESDMERRIQTATGETTPLELASLAASHAMYHDAQLNYIQTLAGDAEVHWKF